MALPAGIPPASFRLEGGCLMCSATAAIWNWSARQDLHLRSPGPKPGMLLLHHALFAPACLGAHRGLCFMGNAGPTHLEPVSRGKNRKLADPKGVAPWVAVRKHLPADNGLLR